MHFAFKFQNVALSIVNLKFSLSEISSNFWGLTVTKLTRVCIFSIASNRQESAQKNENENYCHITNREVTSYHPLFLFPRQRAIRVNILNYISVTLKDQDNS